MINKESIEKVINKHFNTLEDKVNNISQSTQLTGEDIFDITTTGMSYYDIMLGKGKIVGKYKNDPVGYFKTNKGLVFEIERMSPEEYLTKVYTIHMNARILENIEIDTIEDYLLDHIDFEDIKKYKERTLKGSKMPMIMLDYSRNEQEGRHRAIVAQQLEVEEIPVLVVRPYEEIYNKLNEICYNLENTYTFIDIPPKNVDFYEGETVLKNGEDIGGIYKSDVDENGNVFIYNIEVIKGNGANILAKILCNTNVKLISGEATDESKGFWKKMGATFGDYIEANFSTEFTITKTDFFIEYIKYIEKNTRVSS